MKSYLEQAFGRGDVTSARMQAAIREWLNLYYGTQSPGEDAADRLAVLVVSKLCRTVFAEYESRTAEALAPLELTARVKSQLRRYTQLNPQSGAGNQVKNEISIKGLTINKDNHKVTVYGEEIKLTPIEFDILYLLASNPGRVFSTDEIFEKGWNEKVYEANNTVMVHIRRLRGKMKEDTRQNKIITTVWGVGYKIEK